MLAVLWLLPLAAQAAPVCTLLSAPTMDFGSYSALGGAKDAETDIMLSCVPDILVGPTVPYTISLDSGTGNPGVFVPRRLVAGAWSLDYNLFTDITRINIWGDGSPGTVVQGGSCAGLCPVPVYGRIAAGQSTPSAQYRDEVTITVDF